MTLMTNIDSPPPYSEIISTARTAAFDAPLALRAVQLADWMHRLGNELENCTSQRSLTPASLSLNYSTGNSNSLVRLEIQEDSSGRPRALLHNISKTPGTLQHVDVIESFEDLAAASLKIRRTYSFKVA